MKNRYHFLQKIWFKFSLFTAVAALLSLSLSAQNSYTKQWEKSFGGEGKDLLWDVQPTSDGGVILGGSSDSGVEGGKSQPTRKFIDDFWVIKLDAQGNKQWDKTIGGNGVDKIRKVRQIADGDYILFGESGSEVSGDKTEPSKGLSDYWLVKLDKNGNKVWDRTYGGNSVEMPEDLEITSDGGFIMTGRSASGISGDKTQGINSWDYWLLKVDSKGNKLWDNSLEVKPPGDIRHFKLTADKGFLIGGFYVPTLKTKKGQDSTGRTDFWLIKLDMQGKEQWNKNYGTEKYDFLMDMRQTTDGGYILGGKSEPEGSGNTEGLIMKLDGKGNKIWEKTINSELDVIFRTIQPTPDKGYIMAGFSGKNLDSVDIADFYDSWRAQYSWITKLDAKGNKVWETKIESPRDQLGYLLQMPDKGFLVVGGYDRRDENQSEEEIFKGMPEKRINETWVCKLDQNGKKVWSTRIKRKENQTYDKPLLPIGGGFVLWGQELPMTDPYRRDASDYWIVKFRPEGNKK